MGRFANATLVRLSEFLSAGYKKGVRPVKDWRDSTSVAIDLMIYSILNVVSYYLLMLLRLLHVNVSELCLIRPTTLGSISIKCWLTHTQTPCRNFYVSFQFFYPLMLGWKEPGVDNLHLVQAGKVLTTIPEYQFKKIPAIMKSQCKTKFVFSFHKTTNSWTLLHLLR